MTPIRTLFATVLWFVPVVVVSQNVETKTLYVLDTEGNAVSDVNVRVDFCKKEFTGFTNEKGAFMFDAPRNEACSQGRLLVRSSLYMPVDTLLDFVGTLKHQIVLRPISLEGVEIVGYKKIAKQNAEKIVFSLDTKGLLSTAKADLALQRIPNVVHTDQGFSIVGNNQRAKIMINGSEVSEEELKKIDAKDIDKVELLQIGLNDDQNAGEIRLIMKKERTSFYKGELSAAANLLTLGNMLSPTFTFRNKTLDFLVWGSYTRDKQKNQYEVDRDDVQLFSSVSHIRTQQYNAGAKLNLFFSPRWMSSLSYSLWGYDNPSDVSGYVAGVLKPKQKLSETYLQHSANLITRFDVNSHNRLYLKARYFTHQSDNSSTFPDLKSTGRMNEYSGEILYEMDSLRLFKKYHGFAAGLRSIYRHSMLTVAHRAYQSDVQQLYLKDNFALNEHWSVFLLLRGEWDGYRFEQNKSLRTFAFLPAATINYQGKIGSLSAMYVRSIIRPGVDYLNPETVYVNDYNHIRGNLNLRSQTTDKYSVNYGRQIKNSYLTAVLSFSRTKDLIDKLFVDDYNTSVYDNVGKGDTFEATVAYNKPLFSYALNLNVSAGAGYTAYTITPALIDQVMITENRGWFFRSTMNLSYRMPQNWFANFSMNYLSKQIDFASTSYNRPTLNLMLTKTFFQNKLECALSYWDAFNLSGKSNIKYHFKDMRQNVDYRLNASRLMLSVTYYFGKQFRSRKVGDAIQNEDMITK